MILHFRLSVCSLGKILVTIDDSSYHLVILLSMVSGIRSGSVGCRPWLLLKLMQLEIVFHVAVCT